MNTIICNETVDFIEALRNNFLRNDPVDGLTLNWTDFVTVTVHSKVTESDWNIAVDYQDSFELHYEVSRLSCAVINIEQYMSQIASGSMTTLKVIDVYKDHIELIVDDGVAYKLVIDFTGGGVSGKKVEYIGPNPDFDPDILDEVAAVDYAKLAKRWGFSK